MTSKINGHDFHIPDGPDYNDKLDKLFGPESDSDLELYDEDDPWDDDPYEQVSYPPIHNDGIHWNAKMLEAQREYDAHGPYKKRWTEYNNWFLCILWLLGAAFFWYYVVLLILWIIQL
jgi:hypothetical protein